MKILAFSASLRAASLNTKLIALAAEAARSAGADVDLASFNDFGMPHYSQDVQDGPGIPEGCLELCRRLNDADAFMIATPEYNFSFPGHLKNAIDWVSRVKPMPLKGHICFLLSASPSLVGGLRCLWQLRQPIEGLGTFVMPFMYSLPQADKAFGEDGQFVDEKRAESLNAQVQQFIEHVRLLRAKSDNASQ
jgi:NAD(P)H-dependent FMN reductase